MNKHLTAAALWAIVAAGAASADWSMYRGNASRGNYTAEQMGFPLSLTWVREPVHAPEPAWRGEDTRMTFDHAFHVVAADGMAFFGSSVDGTVVGLDADTGKQQWIYYTEGPVRFAPVLWNDYVFVASDDGYLYCLSSKTGQLQWRKRGGPEDDLVIGNGRFISRWPVRGGPAVVDDTLYFAAGIWPTEGIAVYAIDPATGDVKWVNTRAGSLELDQPHPTARARSGISAQGYLAVTADHVLVPTGRAVPAALNRQTGAFEYFHLQQYGQRGGADVVACDGYFFNSNAVFDDATGQLLVEGVPTYAVAVTPGEIVFPSGSSVLCFERGRLIDQEDAVDRKGDPTTRPVLAEPVATIPTGRPVGTALLVADKAVIVGADFGDAQMVMAFDMETGAKLWSTKVIGSPIGLAVDDQRLLVTTDAGWIYCYLPEDLRTSFPNHIEPQTKSPRLEDPFKAAAVKIEEIADVKRGYCIDLGCDQGQLSEALASRHPELHILAIDDDPENVKAARERFGRTGLYGTRVTVIEGDPARTNLPDHVADLIVSGRSVTQGSTVVNKHEVVRLQRPYGGVAVSGRIDDMVFSVSGPLEGAGEWTHQYADPGNTGCSDDRIVHGPLGVCWFDDLSIDMPNRHGRGPAPLFSNGKLIIEGLDGIYGVDAYNGRRVWHYPIKDILKAYDQEHLVGTAGTGSNYCIADGMVYVATGRECIVLEVETGDRRATFETPDTPQGQAGTWGYIACHSGILFGSVANTGHVLKHAYGQSDMGNLYSESSVLFAMDARTGQLLWKYVATDSIRNNAIAIDNEHVYLIDRPIAKADSIKAGNETIPQPGGVLKALQLTDGSEAWAITEDVFGTMLIVSAEHDALLMSYQSTRFAQKSEKQAGMAVFRTSNGQRLWSDQTRYVTRPIMNGKTIYAQPGAWDLLTGKPVSTAASDGGPGELWQLDRSYGCGIMACAAELMVFRSATLGYVELDESPDTQNYGGVRPGCWINAIPAGGMVLMPDATSSCVCSYLMKTSIALAPTTTKWDSMQASEATDAR